MVKMNNKPILVGVTVVSFILLFLFTNISMAHPGNTASDGCHYCRTNCDSWGEAWNQRHCHNSKPAPTYTPPPVYTPPKPVVTSKIETKTEEIPFETTNKNDDTLSEGNTRVVEGTNGVKTISFKVTFTDGVETSREKTGESITTAPVHKVILKGTKKEEPKQVGEVKGAQDQNDPVAGYTAFLIMIGIPAGIVYWIIKRKKRNKTKEN